MYVCVYMYIYTHITSISLSLYIYIYIYIYSYSYIGALTKRRPQRLPGRCSDEVQMIQMIAIRIIE